MTIKISPELKNKLSIMISEAVAKEFHGAVPNLWDEFKTEVEDQFLDFLKGDSKASTYLFRKKYYVFGEKMKFGVNIDLSVVIDAPEITTN